MVNVQVKLTRLRGVSAGLGKQAILASTWDANRRRSSSSHSSVAKKLSHMALS